MKKILFSLFGICIVYFNVFAQSSATEYKTVFHLRINEKIEEYLSCWWPNEKQEPMHLVIHQADDKYAVIENGARKENLNRDQLMSQAACGKLDPYKAPPETHASRLARLMPDGKWNIRSLKKDYGSYEQVLFMRETVDRFVAIVRTTKSNTAQYFLLNAEGEKIPFDAKPENLVTNHDLSRVAVVLDNKDAIPVEQVNKMPADQQAAFFQKLQTDPVRRVWFSYTPAMSTVSRKSKLFFDASGHHFIEVQPQNFFIDGKANKRNISGNGTQLFVSRDAGNWAYSFGIYLTFKDNTTIQGAISPFLTEEDGREYLNWFKIDRDENGAVLKLGRREL